MRMVSDALCLNLLSCNDSFVSSISESLWHQSPTDSLVLEPTDPAVVIQPDTKVNVMVEVVTSSGASALYSVDVPKGSSLLEALNQLKTKSAGFT